MVTSTLLASAGAHLLAGALLAAIGYGLARRPAPTPSIQRMGDALGLWWYLIAASAVLEGIAHIAAASGQPPAHAILTFARMKILLSTLAVWGLAYYVLGLFYQPSARTLGMVAAGAVVQAIAYLWFFEAHGPVGVEVTTWAVRVQMADPQLVGPFWDAFSYVLFYAPPIVFGLLGVGAISRVPSPTLRFRLVGMGLVAVLWHLSSIAWSNPQAVPDAPLVAALSLVYVYSSLVAFMAYYPPIWMQRVFCLTSLADEATGQRCPTGRGTGRDSLKLGAR